MSEKESAYDSESILGSRVTGGDTWHKWGSCMILSSLSCIPAIAFLKHLESLIWDSLMLAAVKTVFKPWQQLIGGVPGPDPFTYASQGFKSIKACRHVIWPYAGLAWLTTITINPKTNADIIFISTFKQSKQTKGNVDYNWLIYLDKQRLEDLGVAWTMSCMLYYREVGSSFLVAHVLFSFLRSYTFFSLLTQISFTLN